MWLMIKRVLTIITLERWTVRWDITPNGELQTQKVTSVQVRETIQLLPQDFEIPAESDGDMEGSTQPIRTLFLNIKTFIE